MIVKHNPYSFLTGDSPFLKTKPMEISSGRFETEVLFELHHEGAIRTSSWRDSNGFVP